MTKHALHNALFAAMIDNNRVLVIELLRFLLPQEQVAQLDFKSLKFSVTVFNDADGNERRADAVVTITTQTTLKNIDKQQIIFLIEHKSSQDRRLLPQLLNYQVLLEISFAAKVIPIVISNARGRWRMPRRFQDRFMDNGIGNSVALDFGYLLLHLPDYSQDEIIAMFPKSHPYLLPLHCIRDLTDTRIATFFRSGLTLELEKRTRLVGRAIDYFLKYDSNNEQQKLS